MFNKKASNGSMAPTETIIGAYTKVIGAKLVGTGSLRIDGEFQGTIDIDGHLILGETGSIDGDIKAGSALLAGKAKSGIVVCKENLHIVSTGVLYGDIQVGALVVDEDAVFMGNCKMNKNEPADLLTAKEIPSLTVKTGYGFSGTEPEADEKDKKSKVYGKVEVPY